MYRRGRMNPGRSQSIWESEQYDSFEAGDQSYENNHGYSRSTSSQLYDNYGKASGSRKRQAVPEYHGDTKQQRMGMDISDLRSTSETEKLLKMLVEQNKLIRKQQEIIQNKTGQNMPQHSSDMDTPQSKTFRRESFHSGSNIWDDQEYGQSKQRNSSFGGNQEISRGQDYYDSRSRSFDSSRENTQRNTEFSYQNTNRQSSSGPYIKSVPISQLNELNKSKINKKERKRKFSAQSQAWSQRSDQGQGNFLNRGQGNDNFSKSYDNSKKSILKNSMQRSTTSQLDESWGENAPATMYEKSQALHQNMPSYDYKHGMEERDSLYNTEGTSKAADQQHWKKQQLNSSSKKSGKYGGIGYFEGNSSYDKDGFPMSTSFSSSEMRNKQRNPYSDFEDIPDTMTRRKPSERNVVSEPYYDSYGWSEYSGNQNSDNFGRGSRSSYQTEYRSHSYDSEQQGPSYEKTRQQRDTYSNDSLYGSLSTRKDILQGVSNQMQMQSTLPFKDRQKSRLQIDSSQDRDALQALGSQMQSPSHFMDRDRSRSHMEKFDESYIDSGQNFFKSPNSQLPNFTKRQGTRNLMENFKSSYQDDMQNIYQAPDLQIQTSYRFSDPYKSQNLTAPYMPGPNRRNKVVQRSRPKQGKEKPSNNTITRPTINKPVTVQSFFRNKYNKLKQTANARNTKSRSNVIARGNNTEPSKKETEFLSDLFSGKRARNQTRANAPRNKGTVGVVKTTGNLTPKPSTTSQRSSVFNTAKQVGAMKKEGNQEQKVIFVPPKNWKEKKSPVSLQLVKKEEQLTDLSRLNPRATELPSSVAEVGNFKNRTRGLGSALETFKQVDKLTKDDLPVIKMEPTTSQDKHFKTESQHKLTIHVRDESAKTQDCPKTASKDKNSQGEGSVTTLIFGDKGVIPSGGKEDSKVSSEEKMDNTADGSVQKEIDVEVQEKLTHRLRIDLSITPAPASEPVTVKMKDKNKTVFVATGSEAEIDEAYKDRIIFLGNTTTGDMKFMMEKFGIDDEGIYSATYNGMEFDTPFTKRALYAKDKEDICMRWTIEPVPEGGVVTVTKQNYLTLFTVTGDEVKMTDEYKSRVVYSGDISKGVISFILKDCNIGDSGTYVSLYDDRETEGCMLKLNLRLNKREQRKGKDTRLGRMKNQIYDMDDKDSSEKMLMEAADAVGLILNVQCWCRQISPTKFRHFGVIHIADQKDGNRGREFFGKDVCLSATSAEVKDEMRTQLFDKAVENLKTNNIDLIRALGKKGQNTDKTSTGMWDIDTGEINFLNFRTKEELFGAVMQADRIDAQRILISIIHHRKYTNKMFVEAVKQLYDKGLIHLVDVAHSIRERENFRKANGFQINFQKLLGDNVLISNETDLAKIGKKSSLSDEKFDRFVMFEGSDVKRRMVDAFQWILRSAESCGMLVHWFVRPVYGETTELLPRFFKKCSIWIQGNLVGESCSYGEKYAIQHAAVDALAYIYENLPVIEKVNKGLPEQYCITYKKALNKAKLIMEVGNFGEEAAMIKACEDFILQYKDDPTPESLEFCKGFPESVYESIKTTSLANNLKVDCTLADNRTVLTISKVMDLYKLLGNLLENDGKSGRFRLMKQPECAVIAKEIRRIAESLFYIEEGIVKEMDLNPEERNVLQKAIKQQEKDGASDAKKGRFSNLVKKQENRPESNRGSGNRGGRGRGRGMGSGQGGLRGRGHGVRGGVGHGFSRANTRGNRGRRGRR